MNKLISTRNYLRTSSEIRIKLAAMTHVEVKANSHEMLCLSFIDQDGQEYPHQAGHAIRLKSNVEGFSEIRIWPIGKPKTYDIGYSVHVKHLRQVEPTDHEPAPEGRKPMNILAQLRERARQDAGVTRENFMESDTDHLGYEVDGEDEFEEEILERTQTERKRRRDNAQSDNSDTNVSDSSTDPADDSDGQE